MTQTSPTTQGTRKLVRIGASATGTDDCPQRQAAKARPAMRTQRRSRVSKPRLGDFPLGPVMKAADDAEFGGASREAALAGIGRHGKPLHPGIAQWARHATAMYLDVAAIAGSQDLRPVAREWIVTEIRGNTTWELFAWGRRYESADGTRRELRLLRHGSVRQDGAGDRDGGDPKGDGGKRDRAKHAVAAYVAAHGRPAAKPAYWSEPYEVGQNRAPVRDVRVVEVGLQDGSQRTLFAGTPAQADDLYAEYSRARVRAAVAGGAAVPGYGCADCKVFTSCQALPRIPGLLGISGPMAPLRTWSVSNGRYYDRCPAQDYLIRQKLPRLNEYGAAAVRGQAVHGWLETTHRGEPHAGCSVWDTPRQPDDWKGGEWRVTGAEAMAGAQMLAHHADLCPFQHGDRVTGIRVEPTLAFHDVSANVIVIAKPDLLYFEDGEPVWRETKTMMRLPRPGLNRFRVFPQLALATVLMAEGALGGPGNGGRIELELLSPAAGDMWLIDPADPAEIAAARAVIRDLATAWHGDETFEARPGRHCRDCPVSHWCPQAAATEGES